MYARVLVPLDGSKLAEGVLPYVRLLCKGFRSRIELLRAIDPVPLIARVDPGHGVHLGELLAGMGAEAINYLEGVAASLRAAGLTVSCAAREGSATSLIASEAEREPATLIAMSTHGRSGLSRWLLGSVTDKVLHATTNPMLVVRSRDEEAVTLEGKITAVIVPLDGSPLGEQVLPHAVPLARALALKVVLVRVTPAPTDYYRYMPYDLGPLYQDVPAEADNEAADYLRQVGDRLRQQGVVSVEESLLHGHPAGAIVDVASELPDSMVAMTTHGRSGVGRWVMGSITDRVVRHSGAPVLVVRAVERNPEGA